MQQELAEIPGCTVLIYDQTCAAEKRRRRKRGTFPDPDKRVIINELVCEGCGDCGVQSNCVSVQPLETEFGRKRTIDQSSCNKDFSCVKGFCPSFVTVHGAQAEEGQGRRQRPATCRRCPSRRCRSIGQTYDIIVTGVGGTGIVTIGAHPRHGRASRRQGRRRASTWPASRRRAARSTATCASPSGRRTSTPSASRRGGADLVLGGDIVVAGNKKVLAAVHARQHPRWSSTPPSSCPATSPATPTSRCRPSGSSARSRPPPATSNTHFIDASRLATALLGQSLGANMFMLGYAYQLGALPLSADAIEQAIALNGEAVAMNIAAFRWGRRAALDPAAVEALAMPDAGRRDRRPRGCRSRSRRRSRAASPSSPPIRTPPMPRAIAHCVEQARAAEAAKAPGKCGLAEAVARYLFKLMAYKDEYEVARLYTDGAFLKQVANEFGGDNLRFEFHLAPPLLAQRDPATGEPRKMSFGPWMMRAFGLLAKLKFLRGTRVRSCSAIPQERTTERKLIADYEAMLDEVLGKLTPDNHPLAVGLAAIPEKIRGFGHVKAAPSRRRQGRRGGAAGAVPLGQAAAAEGGGVAFAIPVSAGYDRLRFGSRRSAS